MITPRTTRLVRVADLHAYRDAAIALATAGSPGDVRDRLVVVPTHAAVEQLRRSIEGRLLGEGDAAVLPEFVTAGELTAALSTRLDVSPPLLTDAEREVLLAVSCRAVQAAGVEPPFRLRPGLIGEALRFYDALRRQERDVETFERLALGALEPGAVADRGAERLVRQTRFLVAAYRDFESRCATAGVDEHARRQRVATEPATRPWREVVLCVTDRGFDRYGLWPVDWALLTRVAGLERIALVVTDTVLAGALHERIHDLLPGIEETRFVPDTAAPTPAIVIANGTRLHVARDREEEVALFARRVHEQSQEVAERPLDAHALVVCQSLPYVYVAREVLRSAGVPCQMADALPLAGEPYAAALDLVLTTVTTNFSRATAVALLRSPQFAFRDGDGALVCGVGVDALDRALSEAGYLGDVAALTRIVDAWRATAPRRGRLVAALGAATVLQGLVQSLTPLTESAAPADQLSRLLTFLADHEAPATGEFSVSRHLRARSAIVATLTALRDAYARFDTTPMPFEELAGLIRRRIEVQTFSPRTGDGGVQVVDVDAARFGVFAHVHLAGLVDGEWPEAPRHDTFYSPAILRDLGWPQQTARAETARAAFEDLLRLPTTRLVVSTFSLEQDALVSPSPFVDAVHQFPFDEVDEPIATLRVFEHERLAVAPVAVDTLPEGQREWARHRAAATAGDDPRFHGATAPHRPASFSLSALERYQECGFRYFAADVLGLEEPPEDEPSLSPRARGRFIHEVFQRFFEAWDARGLATITPERVEAAKALFEDVAAPLLARLPESEAALERTRLFGSAISVGMVDVVLGIEASRPVDVRERWLEYRLEGHFALSPDGGRRVPLRGVADRIDLLEGRRLRVIDYKTGAAPHPARALQVPIYALCAQERLMERDLAPWAVDEAAYVSFGGRRVLVSVVKPGARDGADTLEDARFRLFDLVDGIERGEFAPRPHDPMTCRHCAYAPVCRKDYVDD